MKNSCILKQKTVNSAFAGEKKNTDTFTERCVPSYVSDVKLLPLNTYVDFKELSKSTAVPCQYLQPTRCPTGGSSLMLVSPLNRLQARQDFVVFLSLQTPETFVLDCKEKQQVVRMLGHVSAGSFFQRRLVKSRASSYWLIALRLTGLNAPAN